jgi:type IV pilus assembly protein PilB
MKRSFTPTRKKVGEILVRQGRLTPKQLVDFLRIQKETQKPLGEILVDEKILTQEELMYLLGEQLGIQHIWLRKGLVDPRIVHLLPKEKALFYQVIPMFCVNNILYLATTDPNAIFVFNEVSKITNKEVQPVLCRTDDILEAIHECYQIEVGIEEVMASIDDAAIEVVRAEEEKEISEITEMAEGSPVISLTNMILLKAIRDGASDIHLEREVKCRPTSRCTRPWSPDSRSCPISILLNDVCLKTAAFRFMPMAG